MYNFIGTNNGAQSTTVLKALGQITDISCSFVWCWKMMKHETGANICYMVRIDWCIMPKKLDVCSFPVYVLMKLIINCWQNWFPRISHYQATANKWATRHQSGQMLDYQDEKRVRVNVTVINNNNNKWTEGTEGHSCSNRRITELLSSLASDCSSQFGKLSSLSLSLSSLWQLQRCIVLLLIHYLH